MLGTTIYSRLTTAQTGDGNAPRSGTVFYATKTLALAYLTAQIGDRVYPGFSDQNIYPLVEYHVHQESEESIAVLTGKEFTLSINVVARGSGAKLLCNNIKNAIRALLDRETGAWDGAITAKCFFQGSDDNSESEGANADALFYEVQDEYRVYANT